jgi:putative ABC transport system permease protein
MIQLMAWRNIWRNPTRSWVVIIAIALGIWAAIFMGGFATGMINSYIDGAISTVIGHVQIHHPDFVEEKEAKYVLSEPEKMVQQLGSSDSIRAYSIRSVANGMIASSSATRGIQIQGVEPAAEAVVRGLDQKIIEGEYLEADKRNPILVSQRIADKLKLKKRSRLVLTFQDVEGEIVSAAFRVAGIFDTKNNLFDEAHVFVLKSDLNRLLGLGEDEAHEIALLLNDNQAVKEVLPYWKTRLPTALIEPYYEIAPDLRLYESQMSSVSMIYLVIILLALVFGIINTMLMTILERFRELGMLMAIGMNKLRVFLMIVLETVFLSFVGVPLGLLLGWGTISYFGKQGLNLSAFSESLQMYGMSDMTYFDLNPAVYWQVPMMVGFTALLASIYPALKAIRLKPVEAIRKL